MLHVTCEYYDFFSQCMDSAIKSGHYMELFNNKLQL